MRKWVRSMVAAVCGGVVSFSAWAAPTYLYQFTTHQTRCIGPQGIEDCTGSYNHRPALDQMSYRLTQAGQQAGQGSAYIVLQNSGLEPAFHVQGLAELTLPSYGFPTSLALTPDSDHWETWYSPFFLEGTFGAGAWPGAGFYFFDGGDEIAMGNGIGFLLSGGMHGTDYLDPGLLLQAKGPFEVEGLIIGDPNHPTFFSFTGQWRFAGVVSEPDTSALLLLALGLAGLLTRPGRRLAA